MICRNCSAEIDENSEKCPVCKKDPSLRDYDKKSGKRGPIIIILIAACLLAACIFVGIEISNGQIALPGTTKPLTTQSSKPVFAFSDSETDNTSNSTESEPESSTTQPSTTKPQTSTTKPKTTGGEATAESTTFAGTPFSLKDPKIVTINIKDKNKATVAKYGYIFAQKEQIKSLGQKKFYSFCKNTIGKSELKWLTIKFEDSTGLVFIGNDYSFASYCVLDKNDFIGNSLGKVILGDSLEYIFISEGKSIKSKPESPKASSNDKTTSAASDTTTEKTTKDKATANKATTDNTNSETVYITKSGKKYHRATCSYLTSSKIEIKLSEAKQKGYSPCSRCFG